MSNYTESGSKGDFDPHEDTQRLFDLLQKAIELAGSLADKLNPSVAARDTALVTATGYGGFAGFCYVTGVPVAAMATMSAFSPLILAGAAIGVPGVILAARSRSERKAPAIAPEPTPEPEPATAPVVDPVPESPFQSAAGYSATHTAMA
jgi:hypothetical protein